PSAFSISAPGCNRRRQPSEQTSRRPSLTQSYQDDRPPRRCWPERARARTECWIFSFPFFVIEFDFCSLTVYRAFLPMSTYEEASMNCPSCGHETQNNSKFCFHCGAKLTNNHPSGLTDDILRAALNLPPAPVVMSESSLASRGSKPNTPMLWEEHEYVYTFPKGVWVRLAEND